MCKHTSILYTTCICCSFSSVSNGKSRVLRQFSSLAPSLIDQNRETCFCVRERARISRNHKTKGVFCWRGVHDRVRGGHMKRDNIVIAICHKSIVPRRESLSLSVAAQPCLVFEPVDGKHERKLSPRAASSDVIFSFWGKRELYISPVGSAQCHFCCVSLFMSAEIARRPPPLYEKRLLELRDTGPCGAA